jgi:hypothetical protein
MTSKPPSNRKRVEDLTRISDERIRLTAISEICLQEPIDEVVALLQEVHLQLYGGGIDARSIWPQWVIALQRTPSQRKWSMYCVAKEAHSLDVRHTLWTMLWPEPSKRSVTSQSKKRAAPSPLESLEREAAPFIEQLSHVEDEALTAQVAFPQQDHSVMDHPSYDKRERAQSNLTSTEPTLTLGERRALARRPTPKGIEKLLSDSDPLVVKHLLNNPRLTERDALKIASHRSQTTLTLFQLFTHPKWGKRPAIRLAIFSHPQTSLSLKCALCYEISSATLKATQATLNPRTLLHISITRELRRREALVL